MQVFDKKFVKYDAKQKSASLDDIYIKDGEKYVPLSSLYIFTGKINGIINETRRIRSFADYRTSIKNKKVYFNEYATRDVFGDPDLFVVSIKVPTSHTSISANATNAKDDDKIAYGLKRTLPVVEKPIADAEYLYCKIKGDDGIIKWDFVRLDNLSFFEGTEEVKVADFLSDPSKDSKSLESVAVFDANGSEVLAMYTENGFDFGKPTSYESIDKGKMAKITHTINERGEETTTSVDLAKKYSIQRFETREEPVGNGSNKTTKTSYVIARNFYAQADGQFLAVQVAGRITMVDKNTLVDINGVSITDQDIKVGQPLRFKQGDRIIISEPVTYEQSILRYQTHKVYQPQSEKVPTDETYLRVESGGRDNEHKGKYIREMESVQPKCFTIVEESEENFDAYLVQQNDGGTQKWVLVDKEYLDKNAGSAMFRDNMKSRKKVKRCDYNDSKCHIIQTTSSGKKIEDCSIVNKEKLGELEIEQADKKALLQQFYSDYKGGEYELDDLYLDGQLLKLAPDKTRYTYTDEVEMRDWAADLPEYKSLETKNLNNKKGKMKGGAKFGYIKALKNHYSRIGKWTYYGGVYMVAAGFFIPALTPVMSVFFLGLAGYAAAAPVITGVQAAIKNQIFQRALNRCIKFRDKTEHNRKQEAKDIQKEFKELYQKSQYLSAEQFNDEMSRLMQRVDSFAETTNTSTLNVQNGEIAVDPNNANLANTHKRESNKLTEAIEKKEKQIKACFEKDGTTIKHGKESEYESLCEELETLQNEKVKLTSHSRGETYTAEGQNLESLALDLRIYAYIQQNKDQIIESMIEAQHEAGVELTIEAAEKLLSQFMWTNNGLMVKGKHWDNTKNDVILNVLQGVAAQISTEKIEVQSPLNEGVERKEELLETGTEIINSRTQAIGEIKEALSSVGGFRSALFLHGWTGVDNNQIKKYEGMLNHELPVEQLEDQVRKIQSDTLTVDNKKYVEKYLETVQQIRQEYNRLSEQLKVLEKQGEITSEERESLEKHIRETIADYSKEQTARKDSNKKQAKSIKEFTKVNDLEETLKGVQEMNKEVEGTILEAAREKMQQSYAAANETMQKAIGHGVSKTKFIDFSANMSSYEEYLKQFENYSATNKEDADQAEQKLVQIKKLINSMLRLNRIYKSMDIRDVVILKDEMMKIREMAIVAPDASLEDLKKKVDSVQRKITALRELVEHKKVEEGHSTGV